MSGKNAGDLDLTKVESSERDKLVSQIESYYKQDSGTKNSLAFHWERNMLMLDGQQWLTFEGNRETGGQWQKLQPSPQNEYIPRPVTNYLFDQYQTLKGYILKNKPRITVRPNTNSCKDKTAAKIAELVSETNYERLSETENYEYALSCLITYGTVFKKDYWDQSFTSQIEVPRMVQRPVIDPMTGQATGQMEEVQASDPETGTPLFDKLPLGDVNTSVVEPFRICIDPLAHSLHDIRWIMEYSIRPLSWIVENYHKPKSVDPLAPPRLDEDGEPLPPEQEAGYTGEATEVVPETNLSMGMRRFFQMKSSSGIKGISSGLGSATSSGDTNMIDEAAVVKEYYERPTESNPSGRLIVVANGKLLYAGDSPYSGSQQGDWHPYSQCRWEIVPGRFWGKSPMDDASELQKHINTIDSTVILNRKTMAIPQKKIPRGTMANNDQWSGRPGQKIYYTPGQNGEGPETIPAAGLDAQVFQERAQKVEDLKNIMGGIDILKGDRPPGVTAFSALNLLFEVGTGKLFPIADRWKRFIETSQRKQLQLVAQKYREPRPEFINRLMAMNKELTVDQIKDFVGKDLYDNCNVIIDPSSAVPRMKAAEQAKLMELAQLGVLNLTDPANRSEFLQRLDILGFDSGYGKDADRASYENSLLDELATNPQGKRPVVLDIDNHDIHIALHADREKEPSFLELPFEVQQAYAQHRMEHENMKAQKEQMMLMQAAQMSQMTGQPMMPPEGEANPMDQQEPIRKGSGITAKTKNAMNPDLQAYGTGTRG
jgi:hypothetical protein